MRSLVLTIFMILVTCSFGQDRAIRFSLYPHATYSDIRTTAGIGIGIRIPIGEKFGIYYNHSIGARLQGGLYAHTGATTVAGSWLLSNIGDQGFLGGLGAFLLFLPEGISWTIMENEDAAFTSHLAINSMEYEKINGVEDIMVTFGTSLEFTRNLGERMYFGFEVGTRRGYSKDRWLVDGKFHVGWNLFD